MSNQPNPVPFEGGPYLQTACLCDMILEDKSGALTLIRLIDRVIRGSVGPNPPTNMEPFSRRFFMVIMLKSGMARGRNTVKIVPKSPDGSSKDPLFQEVFFEGDERGVNVVFQMDFQIEKEGLHWFDVYLSEDRLITSIPLNVIYQRTILPPPPGSAG